MKQFLVAASWMAATLIGGYEFTQGMQMAADMLREQQTELATLKQMTYGMNVNPSSGTTAESQ